MTAEQLEAARSERMRQNGHGAITIEDVRTWIEETGLCIFLPRSAQAGFTAPTFVEAVAGKRTTEPTLELIATAESLLVRLEAEGVAVRLNLSGQPGDQPDYVVAGWVLPYIYALRGDRDWRRSPQLTGSRQVSQLAVHAAKHLESANLTASEIRDALGRETTESAVLRALHELWKQLRVIPVVPAVGSPALWQPLRQRFQKAIAEGASTSQVTAISVLASIYLQAVIAATMEDVEMFLSPLTSRSKIREVVRGLAATRQVHSTNLGHSPMFYVAGTLPEFPAVPSYQLSSTSSYRSSNYRGSSYFGQSHEPNIDEPIADHEVEPLVEVAPRIEVRLEVEAEEIPTPAAPVHVQAHVPAPAHRKPSVASPVANKSPLSKPAAPRPRTTSKTPVHARNRGAAASSESRSTSNGDRRRAPAPRTASASGNGRSAASSNGHSKNGNGHHTAASNGNGHKANANGSNSSRFSKSVGPVRNGASSAAKPSNGVRHAAPAKANGAHTNGTRNGAVASNGNGARKTVARPFAKPVAKSAAKPVSHTRGAVETLKRSGTSASASKRMSFAGQAKQAPKASGKPHAKATSKTGSGSARSSRPAAAKRRG